VSGAKSHLHLEAGYAIEGDYQISLEISLLVGLEVEQLQAYLLTYFLDLVVKRFCTSGITLLIRNNTKGFTGNRIEVEMSSGPEYPTFTLMAREFLPSDSALNSGFLALPYVAKKHTRESHHTFTHSYAPPLALYDPDSNDLREKCSVHLKSIVERERDVGEATRGDTSMLSWKVFEAINHYRKSYKPNEQVRYSSSP
jgi:hypothetical protein